MKYALLISLFLISCNVLAQSDGEILQSNEQSSGYVEKLLIYQNQSLLFDYQKAKKAVLKSLEIAEKNNYSEVLPEIYANTGFIFQKEGKFQDAQNYYDKSILLAQQNNNRRVIAIALRFYGTLYADKSEYDKSFKKIREAKSIADKLNDTLISALCLQNLGYTHNKKGGFDSAIFYFTMASEKLKDTRFELMKARGDLNLCMLMLNRGEASNSLINIVKNAIELFRKNDQKRGMAQAYDVLAMYFYNVTKYKECLDAYKAEFNYLYAIKDLQGQCTTLSNVGNVYILLNKYDSSEVYFNKALHLAYSLNNEDEVATGLSNLGQVLNYKGEYKQAIKKLNQALLISKKLESMETTHVILLRLGNSYFGIADYRKALELYTAALKVSKEINDIDGQTNNLSKLTDTYEKTGDFKNALFKFKEYKSLNDSLVDADMYGKLEETEKKFETKIKSDSLKLQAKTLLISTQKVSTRNTFIGIIATAFFLVTAMLFLLFKTYKKTRFAKDKIELLQRELHHRVKNNLAIVARLVEVASEGIENKMALKELEGRIYSIASLHEQLYQQENMVAVNFYAVIQNIFSQINQSGIISKPVKENIQSSMDIELDADKAIPLSLIMNELVTNSHKYAFENISDPAINVRINKEKGRLVMHYKDNGRGLADIPEINNIQSYGFKLIKGLSSQLTGKYRFWNEAGFNFELTIPI